MPEEHIWIEDESGERIRVSYHDLDTDVYPKLWRPTGKFSYSASSFLHLPLTEVPFYIKGWLPKQGKAEIYGTAKAGKSYLALQIARCIGAGEPFLGIPVTQGRVLYLQFELGVGTLQSRMWSTGQEYDEVFVGTTFGMKLDRPVGQDMLRAELEAVKPDVLILDPFIKIISGDENEVKDVAPIVDFFDEVIDDYGCSIQIFHHAGKDIERGGRGSSRLEGWVDSYIELRKLPDKGDGMLRARLTPKMLRHTALPPEPTDIVLAPNFEFMLGEKPALVSDKVLAFMREGGIPVRVQNLIEAGLGSRRAIYDALQKLQAGNMVVSPQRGTYALQQ